jgi:uncharacterized integral membrane protein
MQILLIFSFIIAFVAIIFAIQNTEVTPIRFMIWQSEGSLALILFISLVAGALISYLATTPGQIKRRMTNSNQRKRIAEVEGQLTSTQAELEEAQAQLKTIEEQKEAELASTSDDSAAAPESGEGKAA